MKVSRRLTFSGSLRHMEVRMPTLRPAAGKYREYGKKLGLHINPRSWLLYVPASSCAKRRAERALIAKKLLDKELFLIEILYL